MTKALVVDDNAANLAIAVSIVVSFGFLAVEVRSGIEALNAFANKDFDLILIDHRMTPISGAETIQSIRAIESDEKRKPALIVAMSGSDDEGLVWEILKAGANHFLKIPFSAGDLRDCLPARFGRH